MNDFSAPPSVASSTAVTQSVAVPVTIVTATRPTILSKRYALNGAGELEKLDGGGKLAEGRIQVREVDGLAGLARLLPTLNSAQALIYGVPRDPGARQITTKNLIAEAPDGTTTRTNDAFGWPEGPGVMMLDYDPEPGKETLSREELIEAIRRVAPSLADHRMLSWLSASSAIYHDERELHGVRGQRIWLAVADASDIPRAGGVLAARFWLAGYGNIRVSSNGSMLERTLVDTAVWQPNRLDFAGGAECAAPLDQRRGHPELIEGAREIVDTKLALADLSVDEQRRVEALKEAARADKKSEASARRAEWVRRRKGEMRKALEKGAGGELSDTFLEEVLEQALRSKELQASYIIHVEMENGVVPLAVSDILADRALYHGRLCRDPLEPDYDGGRLVGKIFAKGRWPVIHSFARGPAIYRLMGDRIPIEFGPGGTSQLVFDIVERLKANSNYFDYGEHLALVDDGGLHVLTEDSLRYQLGLEFRFLKEARGRSVECELPPAVARQILAIRGRRGLKALEGVLTGPTIRPDGSVLDKPGYDPATRLYLDLPDERCAIPEKPSLPDAKRALEMLMAPFSQFPFVDNLARGAHLAALLTAAVRPVLHTAPAFGYDAPTAGSGKTLLACSASALVEGTRPDVWPHAKSEEERRKRIMAALLSGARAFIWDNIVGDFDSPAIAALLTGSGFTDRVLGKSEAQRIPNRLFVTMTGNNLVIAGDLMRRVIVCRIDAGTAEPFARTFDSDPLVTCLKERDTLLAAACTLIRARMVLQPDPLGPGRLAAFEEWDNLVRQTVIWAGRVLEPGSYGDPLDLIRVSYADDQDTASLSALLEGLRASFADTAFSAKDVLGNIDSADMEAAIEDLGGERALISARSMGRVLKKCLDRPVSGMRLVARRGNSNCLEYRIHIDQAE
ncbi:hypothetical protein KTN05_13110 [Paracoccus sp. Z118]|uniref:hypothetical protein n=1 Tax=Paracoccus sp. Z118 TaxID=2851017 RepID=UPI001C2BDE5B|nr:hypothetical protein [Paracoccus sp. Z118]MBV0892785.1 hypothetical protein [Paracoccus sp. Z118]